MYFVIASDDQTIIVVEVAEVGCELAAGPAELEHALAGLLGKKTSSESAAAGRALAAGLAATHAAQCWHEGPFAAAGGAN